MKHTCHAEGCDVEVPPRMLMCAPHWRRVPADVQRAVWREYRNGQEVRKDPSPSYLSVQRLACSLVATAEGRKAEASAAWEEAVKWRAIARGLGLPDPFRDTAAA